MMSKTQIRVYSHGIEVKPKDRRARDAIVDYCRGLAQWEYVKRPPSWKPRRIMSRIFAGATFDRGEFRFHRNQLDAVMQALTGAGLYSENIDVVEVPVPEPVPTDLTMHGAPPPRDYQVDLIDYLANPNQSIKVTQLQTGKGKLQSLDSLIKVPGGWKRMGDMQVGDKVTAWDGTTTRVTGVYPQGKKQLYRVTFADGRSTLAGAEHLWKVYYINTVPHRRWRVVDTMEMMRLISMPNPRVYVPLCESEQIPDIKLPIPPYTLGVILGDGGISGSSITITKLDDEVFDNVAAEFPENLEFRTCDHKTRSIVSIDRMLGHPYRDALKSMGLMGKCSHAKFIPDEYMHASTQQRLALLQGLMDTDGTVNIVSSGGAISYSTTSPHLASDVQYLVRSLGGIASIAIRNPSYTYNGEKLEGRKAYQVNIRFKIPSTLFRLSRKQKRTNDDGQYARKLKLRVMSIELASVEEAQCISVEHPDRLYVTDDFIVTHNTFSALSAASRIGVRTVIQVRGGYVDRWLTDLTEFFKFEKGELLVVRGSKALLSIINQAKAGELRAKILVITSKTLFSFFKEYEKNPYKPFYGIRPEELYEVLGAGLRIVDEVHEDYHFNFRSDIYCNIQSCIYLSATLTTEDVFRRQMYDIALPKECWHGGVEYDAYIRVNALFHGMRDIRSIRTTERGKDNYSHGAYETSIMKTPDVLENYLEMFRIVVQRDYIENDWQGGQKCLIFCRLTEFCDIVRDYLKQYYPDLVINSYVAETPEEVLRISDIIVSTIESTGTAVDIPNLKMTLLTRALRKQEANIQVLGRLRRLKRWPEVTPIFNYFVNTAIPKHVEYHEAKMEQFKGKVLSHSIEHMPIVL